MKYPLWSDFCKARPCPAGVAREKWYHWRAGKSRPTIPKIRHYATLFGVSESAIIFATERDTSATTQAELQAIEHRRHLDRDNAKRNARYAADLEYRAAVLAANAEAERKRYAVRGPAPMHAHYLWLKTLTPAERDEHEKKLHRAQYKKHGPRWRAEKKARTPAHIVQKRQAAQVLRADIAAVKALIARVAAIRKHLNTAAGQRGYSSKREWAAADPDGFREWQLTCWKNKDHARDAQARQLPGSWTNEEWWAEIKTYGNACAYCHISRIDARRAGHDLEFDHIVNIWDAASRNDVSNCAPACKSCNSSKGDKDLLEWADDNGLAVHPLAISKYWNLHGTFLGCPSGETTQGHPTDNPLAEDRWCADGAEPRGVAVLA